MVEAEENDFGEYVSAFTFLLRLKDTELERKIGMANWPWRVSVRLIAFAKKSILVLGIILFVLLAVRVYLSQQGPELHR